MKSPMYVLSASLFAMSILMMTSTQADIYKWVDSQGKVHYDQKPPSKDEKVKNVEELKHLAIGKSTVAPPPSEPVSVKAEEKTLEQARAEGNTNKEKQLAYCDEQNKVLRQMVANPVIRLKDGEKEAKILTAKERTDKIAEIEKNISTLCNADILPEGPANPSTLKSTTQSGMSAALPTPTKNP